MATAENALLEFEAGQQSVTMTLLTDSGDQKVFTSTAALWSRRSGFAPVVRPNGLLTGGAVTPHTSNDTVNVAALTLNLNGVETSVSAGTATISRGTGTDVARITSITIDSAGAIAAVAGTAGTALSETRGASGGPPLIPASSVEIAQVRVTSITSAVITEAQIFDVIGLHVERADYPPHRIVYESGSVEFLSALPTIHTGSAAKRVYASFASPIFAEVPLASDFVPPETTHSVTSTQVYGGTIGSTSSTLGQGAFTAYLQNGVNDPLVTLKNETLWFRFYPNRYETPRIMVQGKLGIARTFPAGDSIQANCTISAEKAAVEAG